MHKEKHSYEDIIRLPHHVSGKRKQMTMEERAAQFSPFAALTGYEDAIQESGRLTDRQIELDEYEKQRLDEKLQQIEEHPEEHLPVTITYFQPDEKKEGGKYCKVRGLIKRVDSCARTINLEQGEKIPVDRIYEISTED